MIATYCLVPSALCYGPVSDHDMEGWGEVTALAFLPDGKTAIVYLVNYMDFPAESITVHALGSWKRVRIFEPGGVVKDLESYPVAGGTGVDLEALATVAAVQFER